MRTGPILIAGTAVPVAAVEQAGTIVFRTLQVTATVTIALAAGFALTSLPGEERRGRRHGGYRE